MLSRLNRFLRVIDGSALTRVLSIKETEARDAARLLVSLEEVYEARFGEVLFFGTTPLLIEDPKNAPERLRELIHVLRGQLDGIKLLVDALTLLGEQEAINALRKEVAVLEGRLNAHLQAVSEDSSISRVKEVA